MTASKHIAHTIHLAPLKGITDALFRRVFTSHFPGVDHAIAPFVNPQRTPRYPDKLVADLQPEHACALPVTPQILNTDEEGFVALGNRLYEMGYQEVNWNLGCPVKTVAGKRRGSGLLPYPGEIIDLLDRVMGKLKPALSIKMRLGYHSEEEAQVLLPQFNDYPLTSITIHARLGVQLYRGSVNLDHFDACRKLTGHRLVYNGDIVSGETFSGLTDRFPSVNNWMIGRGLLMNPFLAAEIKGYRFSDTEKLERLRLFHDELYRELKEKLSGPGHLLGRMKQIWIYFIHAFPGQEKQVKKVVRSATEKNYLKAANAVFTHHSADMRG